MRDFKDKVAVITGAASGIGLCLTEYCAQKEMKIILADVEEKALALAESEMKSDGADIIAIVTDVSKIDDVQYLAKKRLMRMGKLTYCSTMREWQQELQSGKVQ